MRAPIHLKCAFVDSQPFKPGTRRLDFFQDEENGPAPSAAAIPEPPLIAWLTANACYRDLLFETLLLPSTSSFRLQVKQPFITDAHSKPGDIDFIACDRLRPNQAVVVEWKKVKVVVTEEGKDKVNKLGGNR